MINKISGDPPPLCKDAELTHCLHCDACVRVYKMERRPVPVIVPVCLCACLGSFVHGKNELLSSACFTIKTYGILIIPPNLPSFTNITVDVLNW